MNIGVLGSGSFGTAMANHLALLGHSVLLWCRRDVVAESIEKERKNNAYFPEKRLADNLQVTTRLGDIIDHSKDIVLAVPTQTLRGVLDCIPVAQYRFLNLAKGIEITSGHLLHQIARETHPSCNYSVLSGPSHAEEVMEGKPTAVVVGSSLEEDANIWQQAFNSATLRVYRSTDVVGIEVGGAIKNVIAVATGIASALRLGDNALAALATRGLAEMMRLGRKLKADPASLMGLAGVGDLMATCYSPLSRNVRFGKAIGRGLSLSEAKEEVGQTAEGVFTTEALVAHAQKLNIELPITEGVYRVLFQGFSVEETMKSLLARDPKSEV